MTTDLHSMGTSPQTRWLVNAERVDLTPPAPTPRAALLDSTPQQVCFDLNRAALAIIDMQNDFCAKGGWVDRLGADYTRDRAPIELRRLLQAFRDAGGAVLWVKWGNRPDLANMPPNQRHLYKPKGVGIGLGEPLPGRGERLLQQDT
jgi:ureidoacrylate peracid hydrolase